MALVFGYPRSAFDMFDSFSPRFDRFWDDPFLPLVEAPRKQYRKVSKVRVKENKKGWNVKVSLPGIRFQEHVKVHQTSDCLKVVAKDGYHKYVEKIELPAGIVDLGNISAQFENQVLTIWIPKLKKNVQEKEIQIEKTEAQKLKEEEAKKKEEEAKKKQEEESKKLDLLYKRLSGPKVTFSESEIQNTLSFDFGEGISKDNINIELLGNVLTISVKIEEEDFQYSFEKSVTVPDNVKEDQVSAKFEGSTLVVTYPKEELKKPFKIAIADSNPNPTAETQPKEESAPETTSSALSENNEQEESNASESSPEVKPETSSEETKVVKEEKPKIELGEFVEIAN